MVKKIISLSLITFGLQTYTLIAQTSWSVANNQATINGIHFEYALGEMVSVQTAQNNKLIVTQGFLQPYAENKPTTSSINQSLQGVSIYPNPTSEKLTVRFSNDNYQRIQYKLHDALGGVLQTGKIVNQTEFVLNLESFAVGNYYLMLSTTDAELPLHTSYKIQKK